MPISDGSILAIQPYNASGFNTDKAAKSTLVASKPPFKP